jgi:hypothetical protein
MILTNQFSGAVKTELSFSDHARQKAELEDTDNMKGEYAIHRFTYGLVSTIINP